MIDPIVVEELIDRALYARKTAPSLSALEKHAAQSGGARNHCLRLDDGVIIKDTQSAPAVDIGLDAVIRV